MTVARGGGGCLDIIVVEVDAAARAVSSLSSEGCDENERQWCSSMVGKTRE